jgi:hypothetical protein
MDNIAYSDRLPTRCEAATSRRSPPGQQDELHGERLAAHGPLRRRLGR